MQNPVWMRPALQNSEAVLMAALPRRVGAAPRYRAARNSISQEGAFRPVPMIGQAPTMALSTYVRPRGSMAGRGVLRAAGYSADPYAGHARPRYWNGGRYTRVRL